MSFRSDLLPDLADVRSILGPGDAGLDMRPTGVAIVTTSWSGGIRNSGTPTVLSTVRLPPYTRVRHVSLREIAESGGRFEEGDVLIGPIDPAFSGDEGGGGFTEAQLAGKTTSQGTEVTYQLTQQSGATGIAGTYTLIEFRRDRNFRFEVVARRSEVTP